MTTGAAALPFRAPEPPDWRVDFPALAGAFPWLEAMRGCPQDPAWHGEGDVWTHMGMVLEALARLTAYRELPEQERQVLFAAALLHDVAKPASTRRENDRITSRGHSRRGSIAARRILWELGAEFTAREHVCALVRHHQAPFHLLERPDAQRLVFRISQTARCDLLALLATADAHGRECADRSDMATRAGLFVEYCAEQGCLRAPRQFASSHSRFEYFRTEGRDPDYLAHERAGRPAVTVMSGLPGAGKDTWIAENVPDLPRVSLDEIRGATGAAHTGGQGAVVQAAREQARVLLRGGGDFVWSATNVSREIRRQVVDLAAAYDARVRIVYVEASHGAYFAQNRARAAVVPEGAIERLLERWEVPDATEAHEVEAWVDGRRACLLAP